MFGRRLAPSRHVPLAIAATLFAAGMAAVAVALLMPSGSILLRALTGALLLTAAVWLPLWWLLGRALQARDVQRGQLDELAEALDLTAIVSVTDTRGRILYANRKFCEISGYSRDELLGRDHRIVNSGQHPKEFFRDMYQALARGEIWRAEICNRAKNGELYWVDATMIPRRGETGRIERYASIRFDITDRKRVADALIKARVAEESNRAKGRLLAQVSHELRTPLNAVLGFTQILQLDSALAARHAESVGYIRQAGEHLVKLVDDLLDLSRLDEGRMPPLIEPVDAAGVIDEAIGLVGDSARRQDIGLEHRPGALPRVHADRMRLKQALLNLLSNAIKYNRPRGLVSVELRAVGAEVAIEVADTGRGLNPDQLTHLFEPFNRLGAERTSVEGTGLGLVVTQRLVESMRGRLEVDSEPGRGSRFTIWLPAAEAG
jgi:PAS domain S-box-containing protein